MTAPANARVRIRFEYDPDAFFENEFGERGPLTPEQYAEVGPFNRGDRPQTYEEYLTYWGNPDRHLYAVAVCETRCDACDRWSVAGTLSGIDLMDDDAEVYAIERAVLYSPEQTAEYGYLGDIARELFAEYGPRETTEPTTYRTDADVVTALLEAFEDPTIPDAAFGARVRVILERRTA